MKKITKTELMTLLVECYPEKIKSSVDQKDFPSFKAAMESVVSTMNNSEALADFATRLLAMTIPVLPSPDRETTIYSFGKVTKDSETMASFKAIVCRDFDPNDIAAGKADQQLENQPRPS